jgi:hypothetical protein
MNHHVWLLLPMVVFVTLRVKISIRRKQGRRQPQKRAGAALWATGLPGQVWICVPIGRLRIRLPVAAKIALHSAGVNGGRGGSPTPLARTS